MISDELRPYIDNSECDGIDDLGERLLRERPVPRAGFRAELGAQLRQQEARRVPSWRPKRLGVAIAAYASSGLVLLAVAALGLAGAGPLGY